MSQCGVHKRCSNPSRVEAVCATLCCSDPPWRRSCSLFAALLACWNGGYGGESLRDGRCRQHPPTEESPDPFLACLVCPEPRIQRTGESAARAKRDRGDGSLYTQRTTASSIGIAGSRLSTTNKHAGPLSPRRDGYPGAREEGCAQGVRRGRQRWVLIRVRTKHRARKRSGDEVGASKGAADSPGCFLLSREVMCSADVRPACRVCGLRTRANRVGALVLLWPAE